MLVVDHRFDSIPVGRPAVGSVGGARPALLSSRSISPHGGDERGEAFHRGEIAHVDLERQEGVAELVLQLLEPLAAPSGADRPPAAADELARRGLAEAGGRAGDQDRLHRVPSSSSRRASTRSSGLHAKFLGDRQEIRLVRFEEAQQRGEQRRLAGTAAELIRPDSGQVEEPMRPPFVAERCRKRGEGERDRIGWTWGSHGLETARRAERECNWRRS